MPRIYGTGSYGSFLYIDYTIGEQNLEEMWTDVHWTAGIRWGTYFFRIQSAVIYIGSTLGETEGVAGPYTSAWPLPGAKANTDWPYASATTRVQHGITGLGDITFNGSANWEVPKDFESVLSAAVSLPDIQQLTPDAPSTPVVANHSLRSLVVSWTPNGDNGMPITGYEIGYGENPDGPTWVTSAVSSPKIVNGLDPGLIYHFWVRAINAKGVGPFSGKAMGSTRAGVLVNVDGVYRFALPYLTVDETPKLVEIWIKNMGVWRRAG